MTDPVSHLDESGRPRMVDVSGKERTARVAVAEGRVSCSVETLRVIQEGRAFKGNVLRVAEVAGVMGAKRTADLIPLCHPLPLNSVEVRLQTEDSPPGVRATATVKTVERTGVEMEALVAVSAALLTVYDMCKSSDRGMTLEQVRLLHKEGGGSGAWNRGDGGEP